MNNNYKSRSIKKITNNEYLMYTLLFLLVGATSYFWVFLAGKSMLKNTDSFNQFYPFLVYMRRSLKALLFKGEFEFWSWSIGVGNDSLYNLGSLFFDPFNYIAASFPIDKIELGYTITEYLKLYFAGLLTLSFLRYQDHSKSLSIIGGISYAFSSWGLRAIAQTPFLTQMVVFPLIVWGIEKYEKEKKSFLFIIAVTFSLVSSIYFSYMSGILIVLYLLGRFYTSTPERKSVLHLARFFFKYLSRVLVSVLLSGISLVPALLALLQADKGEKPDYDVFPTLKATLLYIPGYISNHEIFSNYSAVALGALFFAMIPAMFICIKDKRCKLPIIMFFICAVFLFFPIVNSLFNGLNYPVGRWCYGMVFFYTWAGISSFEYFERSNKRIIRKYLCLSLILYSVALLNLLLAGVVATILNRGAFYICIINLFFSVIFSIILIIPDALINRKTIKSLSVMIAAINLSIGTFVYYAPNITTHLSDHRINGLSYEQYSKSLLVDFDPSIDDDFYRVEYAEGVSINPNRDTTDAYNTVANESIFTGIPSVFSYSSYIDPLIFEFDNTVGINNSARTRNSGNAGRSRLSFLLGTQYYLARNARKIDDAPYGYTSLGFFDNTMVMENKYDVGLGYVYPYVISYSDYMKYNYLEREQVLMQAAVVPDDYNGNATFIDTDELVITTEEIEYEITESNGLEISDNRIKVNESDAYIELTFNPVSEEELYIYFSNFNRIPNSLKNLRDLEIGDSATTFDELVFNLKHIGYEDNESYVVNVNCGNNSCSIKNNYGATPQATYFDDYLGHLGYYETSPNAIRIIFKTIGTYNLGAISLYAVPSTNFEEQATNLINNRFVTTSMDIDSVKGYVDSDGGILYLSIINNGGWSAYVDGERVDISNRINIAFIGLELTAGHHEITLKYECTGFKPGVGLTVIGIASFLGLMIYEQRQRTGQSEQN